MIALYQFKSQQQSLDVHIWGVFHAHHAPHPAFPQCTLPRNLFCKIGPKINSAEGLKLGVEAEVKKHLANIQVPHPSTFIYTPEQGVYRG